MPSNNITYFDVSSPDYIMTEYAQSGIHFKKIANTLTNLLTIYIKSIEVLKSVTNCLGEWQRGDSIHSLSFYPFIYATLRRHKFPFGILIK